MNWRLRAAEDRRAAAFAELVLPHLDSAYNLARWLMRDAGTAEDVVQDSLVRALSYFDSFRGGDGRAWVMRIVRNTAYGALAARRQRMAVHLDDAPLAEVVDQADDPEVALTRGQDRATLDAALAALPAELRECLVLRELEEFSYKEVAAITGVPIGTVMSRLWRARQALAGAAAREDET